MHVFTNMKVPNGRLIRSNLGKYVASAICWPAPPFVLTVPPIAHSKTTMYAFHTIVPTLTYVTEITIAMSIHMFKLIMYMLGAIGCWSKYLPIT